MSLSFAFDHDVLAHIMDWLAPQIRSIDSSDNHHQPFQKNNTQNSRSASLEHQYKTNRLNRILGNNLYPNNNNMKQQKHQYIHPEAMILDLCKSTTYRQQHGNDNVDDEVLYRQILDVILSNMSSYHIRYKIIRTSLSSSNLNHAYDKKDYYYYKYRYCSNNSSSRCNSIKQDNNTAIASSNKKTRDNISSSNTTDIVHCTDYYGNTPLHLLCHNQNIPSSTRLSIIQLLVNTSNEVASYSNDDITNEDYVQNDNDGNIWDIMTSIVAHNDHKDKITIDNNQNDDDDDDDDDDGNIWDIIKTLLFHPHEQQRKKKMISSCYDYGTVNADMNITIPNTAPILRERNLHGSTVLHKACQNLISNNINNRNNSPINISIIHYLIVNYPAALCKVDDIHGNLPIHEACIACSKYNTATTSTGTEYHSHNVLLEMIVLLVQQWPECCSKQNKDGNTPLHLAVQQYHRHNSSYDSSSNSSSNSSNHITNIFDPANYNIERKNNSNDNDSRMKHNILNSCDKSQMIDEIEDNFSFQSFSDMMSYDDNDDIDDNDDDDDDKQKNKKSTSTKDHHTNTTVTKSSSSSSFQLPSFISPLSPDEKKSKSFAWPPPPRQSPLPSLISKKKVSNKNKTTTKIKQHQQEHTHSVSMPTLPFRPSNLERIVSIDDPSEEDEEDDVDDDVSTSSHSTLTSLPSSKPMMNYNEKKTTTTASCDKSSSPTPPQEHHVGSKQQEHPIYYQLDIVQYLVDMYPYALRMKNKNGHTPLEVATVSSTIASMKLSSRSSSTSNNNTNTNGGCNPIIDFLSECTNQYYPNGDDNDDSNTSSSNSVRSRSEKFTATTSKTKMNKTLSPPSPPPPVVPSEVWTEEQYANRYFLIKQLPSSLSSSKTILSINYDAVLQNMNRNKDHQEDFGVNDGINDELPLGSNNNIGNEFEDDNVNRLMHMDDMRFMEQIDGNTNILVQSREELSPTGHNVKYDKPSHDIDALMDKINQFTLMLNNDMQDLDDKGTGDMHHSGTSKNVSTESKLSSSIRTTSNVSNNSVHHPITATDRLESTSKAPITLDDDQMMESNEKVSITAPSKMSPILIRKLRAYQAQDNNINMNLKSIATETKIQKKEESTTTSSMRTEQNQQSDFLLEI